MIISHITKTTCLDCFATFDTCPGVAGEAEPTSERARRKIVKGNAAWRASQQRTVHIEGLLRRSCQQQSRVLKNLGREGDYECLKF